MIGWTTEPLGKLCEVLDRYRKPITKSDRRAGPYPYFGAMGVVDYVDGYLFDEPLILLGEDGAKWGSGEPCAFKAAGKYWVNNHAHIMRPDRSQVLDDWLVYYLCGTDLLPFVTGLTVPKLNQERMREIPIPVPPLEEQRRIVAVLDEAFAAIATATANAEKSLANARELFSSYVSSALRPGAQGFRRIRFGEFCQLQRGFDLPTKDRCAGSVPLVSSSGVIGAVDQAMVAGPGVITGRSGSIGNVFFESEDFWPLNTTLYVKDFFGNAPRFVYHFLRAFDLSRYATGSGVPTLNRNFVNDTEIWVPEMAVQAKLADAFDDVESETDGVARVYRAKILQFERLRQSLLHRAFSGKLTSNKARTLGALNNNFATPEFAAKIVAFAYERHAAKNRVRNFGTVKAEKILHMVEALGGIDLGRQPLREAAGPDDAKHRHATWDWARSHDFFRFNKLSSGGHDFEKLSSYSAMIKDARTAIAGSPAEKAVELLVDMDRDFAELIATTYAAWNNLIIDQCAVTDDAIVLAARDNWHRDKLRFDPSRFYDAIRFIRSNAIVPNGTAKRVGGQEALLF